MKTHRPFWSRILSIFLLLLLLIANDAKNHKTFDGTEAFGVETSNHFNPKKSKSYLSKKRMEDSAKVFHKREK